MQAFRMLAPVLFLGFFWRKHQFFLNKLELKMQSNHYNGITPKLGYQITEVLKLCSSTNAKKISELTKEACTALGLPLDTKGGGKPPAQNVAIFEWLRDNKTTNATESIDLPIVEPVAPAEEVAEAIEPVANELNLTQVVNDAAPAEAITQIEPAEVLPVPEVTTNADLFALKPSRLQIKSSLTPT